jgi:hypothetical protein
MASFTWADVVSGKKIKTEDIINDDVEVENRTRKPPPGFELVVPNNNNTKKIIFQMKDKKSIETILKEQDKVWTIGQNRIQFFFNVCLNIDERIVIFKKLKVCNLKMIIIGKDIEIINHKD